MTEVEVIRAADEMLRVEGALPDIKPQTPLGVLQRSAYVSHTESFPVELVAPVVGMAPTFIRKVIPKQGHLSPNDVITLLDQDAYSETFVRRSQVIDFLLKETTPESTPALIEPTAPATLIAGEVLSVLNRLPRGTVQCVVTSTPYWAMRLYDDPVAVAWADGEVCPFGHEQTPEGFVRHSVEVLYRLMPVLTLDASVWWNLMDSFNTRTQIRGNAAEALRAMQGKDGRSWGEHDCRRYSAGHSYLKDGEQCLIPAQVAQRASRIGYFVKSIITWAKTASLPEPQNSRVSRNLEYVLHLTTTRTPKFDKDAYRSLAPSLGGRNPGVEQDKLSDVWIFTPSNGRNGHGAQFPAALPGRCIGLTTDPNDLVLDPFVGSGNAAWAARSLGRRFVGIDVSNSYLAEAERRLGEMIFSCLPNRAASDGKPSLSQKGEGFSRNSM